MKKSLIAASASAVALAAMPVMGAFADVTDTVKLTVDPACSIGASTSTTGPGKTISEDDAVNSHLYQYEANGTAGGTIKVSCNNASGWHIKAVGASTEGANATKMVQSNSGTPIATGTATSGDVSNWAFKVAVHNGTTGVTIADGFSAYHAVPDQATKVASGSATISEGQIDTGYQVWVSATQEADTYTGKVTYTVHTGTGA